MRRLDTSPLGLPAWLGLYVAAVLTVHAFVGCVLLLLWHSPAPFTVWQLILGIISSWVVALVAGTVTIVVTWGTTQKFGSETVGEISLQVQQAISRTIASTSGVSESLNGIVARANETKGTLVVLADPDAMGLTATTGGLLAERYSEDLPTLLALRLPDWFLEPDAPAAEPANIAFWKTLSAPASNNGSERAKFARRRFYIVPIPQDCDTGIVSIGPPGGDEGGPSLHALWSPGRDAIYRYRFGVQSSIDQEFGREVLSAIMGVISEPSGSYAREFVDAEAVLAGMLTGLVATRSITSSQIVQGLHSILGSQPRAGATRFLKVPLGGTRMSEFEYSPEQFFPPAGVSADHSGALLADLVASKALDVEGRRVWEVGAGPGYVTVMLSQHCGDGHVFATDNSERALLIARKNVDENGRGDRVTFAVRDCLEWTLEITGDGGLRLSKGGEEETVDDVLLDLPLLPYHGVRRLAPLERAYLEKANDGTKCVPPTLREMLRRLGPLIPGTGLRLIVPACARDDGELEALKSELAELCPEAQVRPIGKQDGFVHCFVVSATEQTP